MNRWIEHFSDLYGTERSYTAPAIDKVPSRLSNNRVSGRDAVPADLIKACRQVWLSQRYNLLLKYWRERTYPQEMRGSYIITLYKNKGTEVTSITTEEYLC